MTASPAAEPTVRVTRYTVTCIPPESAPDAHVWALYVEQKRDGTWVVTNGHEWLDEAGQWHPGLWASPQEPARFFDEATALRLAQEAAPKVVINGRTVAQALALFAARADQEQP